MESSDLTTAREFLIDSRAVLDACIADDEFSATMVRIVEVICRSLREGGKLLLAGNGGSAGDAQHIAGEFLSRLNYDRAPLPAVALTTDTSVLTAIGNDYGYDLLFERQVLGLGQAGDVFIGISTSGNSPNILNALKAARRKDMVVIGFAGQTGGKMTADCDHILRVPSLSTPFIQQIHIVAAHIICGMVEANLFPRPAATTA